jgi:orotate phosphoribosyltransferase
VKEYGTGATVEGGFTSGETAVLIDDLITNGSSKIEAADKLKAASLEVHDVVVLIDRGSGAEESLAEAGLQLHAVFTLPELLDHWAASGVLEGGLLVELWKFLER